MNLKNLPSVSLMLVACLITAAGVRAGSEDGGIRSVFAFGAGTRAQALGGAYAARADDGSVLFWNPGALGLLTRAEFQAGHASLYGLGFNEQYASFILPSWRYGVFAAGLRHFGVGGIEERDARNVLLSEDLSSNEHELSLAYSRPFGEAWSLGGSVKLRRQELAGLAGSGLGIDMGALLRPAVMLGWRNERLQPLSVGLAMSNFVEPAMRLDEESIRDPGAFRLGFSYEYPLSTNGRFLPVWLVPVLDFEKVANMSMRVHGGLEINYQLLALRFGYGGGRFAAGTGVGWRDFDLGYAYEDSPLENVHRLSLSYQYGRTIGESRQAALRAQDEALQAKLAAAFQERQAARIDELMREATAARGEGDFDGALNVLSTLEALAPEHKESRALASQCLKEKAEKLSAAGDLTAAVLAYRQAVAYAPDDAALQEQLEHCQAESDVRAARSEELRRRFAAGLDAFSADRLAEARRAFRGILDDHPGDAETEGMLARTDQAILVRSKNLIEQAGRFTQRGFLREAEELLNQAEALDKNAAGLAQARREYAAAEQAWRERADAVAGGAAQPKAKAAASSEAGRAGAPPLSRQKREDLADLYQRGNAAAAAGRNDDAMRYWELVWSAQPGYEQVDEFLKREYLTRGMEVFAAGRFEEATSLWEKALRIDPEDARVLGYLGRAREQIARTQEILHD